MNFLQILNEYVLCLPIGMKVKNVDSSYFNIIYIF